jgi:hypothetical protein
MNSHFVTNEPNKLLRCLYLKKERSQGPRRGFGEAAIGFRFRFPDFTVARDFVRERCFGGSENGGSSAGY